MNGEPATMTTAGAILRTMRPYQWVKNILLFTAVIFDGHLGSPTHVAVSLIGFALFCLISSSVYLLNDAKDHELDRQNPEKAHRPIAAGHLSPGLAYVLSFALTVGVLAVAFSLSLFFDVAHGVAFGAVLVIYYVQNLFYSWWFKRQPVLDVMSIAIGFVLRILAGGILLGIGISHWAIVCTFFLSLFLGFAKRRYELATLDGDGSHHRPALAGYDVAFIDQMLTVVLGATVVTYALYTIDDAVIGKLHAPYLHYSLVFVVYGLFRYLHLIHRGEGGDPARTLLSDVPILVCAVLWLAAVLLALYVFTGDPPGGDKGLEPSRKSFMIEDLREEVAVRSAARRFGPDGGDQCG